MVWMSNVSNKSNVWQDWRGGCTLKGVGKTYFSLEELAAKMQSLRTCEHLRHIRENEMCSLCVTEKNCQMKRGNTYYAFMI